MALIKKYSMKEIVFEIFGEGGGINISRVKNKSGEKFLYHHREFDPTDEGLGIDEKSEYLCFEIPFQLINNKYNWYLLHITVHKDYRNYVIEKLIENLNENFIKPEYFNFSREALEHCLGINLECKLLDNKQIWSYTNNG